MILRFCFLFTAYIISCTFSFSQTKSNSNDLKLWYDQPAKVWEEALPLGNGRTGAMVFGKINKERYQLNDNTLWSGFPDPGNNPNGPVYLPQLRQAIFEGDYAKAATFWKKMQGPYSARYLTMADLFLDFKLKDSNAVNYHRELNLNNALHTVSYQLGGVNYKRETLISYPDKVMVIRITSDQKNAISFVAGITSKLRYAVATVYSNYLIL